MEKILTVSLKTEKKKQGTAGRKPSFREKKLQKRMNVLLKERKDLLREISSLQEQRIQAQRLADQAAQNSRRYSDIQFHLYEIHQKAEAQAFALRESAKEEAMDAISVIDDIKNSVSVFRQDVKTLKKDLDIGVDTVKDRITAFSYELERFESTLNQVKERFFDDNHIPKD